MCSFITQHNAKDVASFEGACNWHFGEVFSSRMNPGFHCTGQMADSMYGVVWVSGLLIEKKGQPRAELFPTEKKAHNKRTPFPREQSARALRPNT